MRNPKIILSGGGTGGHIFPAIAIAQEINDRYPNAEILFVGAKNRMEMQRVPQAGYPIKGLWISGIQRKLNFSNLMFPIKLLSSLMASRKILKKFKPDVVIGTGGFASGPLLYKANSLGLPTLIQEQNSYAGITNKWLSSKADKICVAYQGMEKYFPKEKIVFTGNPIRKDLLNQTTNSNQAKSDFNFDTYKPVLLILGGSLGARKINQLIENNLDLFEENNIQVLWQTGKLYYKDYKKYHSKTVKVHQFLNEMNKAYAAANFIVSRSGAGSVSELCVVGKPVIFVPSPNVAEDHQTKNAKAISEQNAAITISENQLVTNFKPVFKELINSLDKQNELSKNILKLARPKATKEIVDEVEKIWNLK
ncbi:MAG: undecaprenyldiphospho-muramoylpentapeptide beta-N-acetylglucosaminyltransferase [Bacteroidota bacterium]